MNNNKFEKMMRSYTNREVEQFELKEKRTSVKFTSILAATLVLAIIATVLLIPSANTENDFTLTVSAADVENQEVEVSNVKYEVVVTESGDNQGEVSCVATNDETSTVERIYTCPPLVVEGKNIEKVLAYSENEHIAIAFFAKKYNVTDKYHYENYEVSDDVPDPLIVIPYEKNSKGEMVEADIDTVEAREKVTYTYVEIVDINKNADEKYISLSCYPVNENGQPLMRENYSSEYNDKITVEVTYLDGEIQTKHAVVSYDNGEMKFDIID